MTTETNLDENIPPKEVFIHFTGQLSVMLAAVKKDAKGGVVRPEELIFIRDMANGLLGAATDLVIKDKELRAEGSVEHHLCDAAFEEVYGICKYGVPDGNYKLNGVKYMLDELQLRYAAECRRRGFEPDPELMRDRKPSGRKKK